MADKKLHGVLLCAFFLALLAGCGASPLGVLPDVDQDTVAGADSAASDSDSDAAAALPADDCLLLDEPSTPTHAELLAALNEFRVNNGLEPLVYSRRLEMAADAHARDLYERDFFAHINPDGQNPGQRALTVGFCHEYVGENIAAGQKSVPAAQTAWENSPSHRSNMLQPAYKLVGVGFYQAPTGRLYWAQEMAYDLR